MVNYADNWSHLKGLTSEVNFFLTRKILFHRFTLPTIKLGQITTMLKLQSESDYNSKTDYFSPVY